MADGGHEVLGIRRGWGGLLETNPDDEESIAANVVPLSPAAVRTIDRTGGTMLHTSRTNPGRVKPGNVPGFLADQAVGDGPFDFTAHTIRVIERLGLDALVPIGGDDTLSYGLRLHDEGIPVIAIPKTMDNDVHGTDYCIGFSTAVTRGVEFVHALRTSTGSHERIAVIELFGRYSGRDVTRDRISLGRRPGRDLRSAVRRRTARQPVDGRQARQPVELLDDDDLGRRHDRRWRHGALRRGRCLRAPQAGRHRSGRRRADHRRSPGRRSCSRTSPI